MAKKENKSISKSVRMTETVFNIVDEQNGTSFNQKFEDLVLFCKKKLPDIDDMIKIREKRFKKLGEQIQEREELLRNLDSLHREVERILQRAEHIGKE